ncbi:hypothetical protein BWI15_32475 [Kribbella sp. ALI-6-A]|uniref:hypothetical protein n=1 Tax=Kribbella sp. ALI-6-A TaxID=1933817 RepID=UPI00097C3229|nr:hypothetical protein [Kribbella sp. ALI-6-A]ONI67801.1 hypothetical protein BWI15_32475 [Kribbella sp. ALI-6-A]
MRLSDRALQLTARISLLIALASLSAFLLVRTYLGDPETLYNQGTVSETVSRGPVTMEKVRWQLGTMQLYTQLIDEDRRKVVLENNVPGSVVVAVHLAVTPLDGVDQLSDGGFVCDAALRDDRGNVWKNQNVDTMLGPSSCSDDDHPLKLNQPNKLVKLFVVPASAVPHLVGVEVGSLAEYRRVLITF